MSTARPKWAPRRLMDLFGHERVTRRDMESGVMVIPAGARVTVTSGSIAWNKLRIIGPKCDCCGVRAAMSRVHIS
ncbi:MAG: hypothetical protein KGL35_10280, partial [Bradyrhizobium sp.]|nr:hypothetical protein [Bradyrhizobium sp.]